MKLRSLTAIPLEATYASIFGGEGQVPPQLRTPAAHFQRIPRKGQFTTLVIAESEDGLKGYGECFGLPHPLQATSLVNHVIAPAVVGAVVEDPFAMTADLRDYFYALGLTRGAAMEALSGVDIALWDLKARDADMPLARLLGGTVGPVSVYVSPIAFRQTAEETARDVKDYIRQGYKAFKLKIGRGIKTDLEHIAAARDAAGDAPLYLDANCAYDVETAIALAQHLAVHDIGWLEEPINPDNPAALAEVRAKSPVPVGAGENEFCFEAHAALVAAGAVDFLQPNITRAGGISGMLQLGELADRNGIWLAPHGVGGCVAVAASLHASRAAKAFHAYEANRLLNPLRDQLGIHPAELRDGCLIAADLPGHGGEPDMAKVEKYRIDLTS
ncbi:mandelate racemase/muconate lactonizing enzyme family protein [Paracoccus sp. (in: a-proteobacteria)]|uniref:mandelate racemase/muconate lactonizing enzyme family protein n=1 Tax=Paracoccus sp. TaxID=267 RepID=UPI0028A91C16|nr:mandelate racemase/muconate lactonizing enzyme family protein [Paracoccus sp. (in: a-proteobacteria)]